MTEHPYPRHVLEAVATKLVPQRGYTIPFEELHSWHRAYLMKEADEILTALWDASRVDLEQDYDTVPAWSHILANDGYVIWKSQDGHFAQGGPAAANYLSPHAHILYWGTHDR